MKQKAAFKGWHIVINNSSSSDWASSIHPGLKHQELYIVTATISEALAFLCKAPTQNLHFIMMRGSSILGDY